MSLNRNSDTLGRGVSKTTKQQHLKRNLSFSPRQIYFVITAFVINFTGNFYTWLVSLSGALFSLPPLLSWGVVAVNSDAKPVAVKNELFVLCKSEESQDPITPWRCKVTLTYFLVESTLQHYPYCKVIWREYYSFPNYINIFRMLKYLS